MANRLDRSARAAARTTFAAWLARTGDARLAARKAGVSDRTARRWRATPAPKPGPEPRSTAAAPGAVRPEAAHALPAEHDRFFGRDEELAAFEEDLSQGRRLVSFVGPGGIGKTRLSRRAATRCLDRFAGEGGVWFCDLTQAHSAEDLVRTVQQLLTLPETLSRAPEKERLEGFGRALAERGPMLLVLDNFEQLVEEGAPVVRRWLEMAPHLILLVTSRRALRVPGECLRPVGPLAAPPQDAAGADLDELERYPAVALFLDRGRAARPGFALTAIQQEALIDLVRQLEGIPLALELAAARLSVTTVTQIRERLTDRLDILADTGTRTAPHQATLRHAMEWSWSLLPPALASALAQCSVFAGRFCLEAAEAVVRLPEGDGRVRTVLDAMQMLREHSLLRVVDDTDSGFHFDLYASVRELAAEKLAEHAHAGTVRHRLLEHYVARGEALMAQLRGPAGRETRRELARVAGHLRRALACSPHAERAGVAELEAKAAVIVSAHLREQGAIHERVSLLEKWISGVATAPDLQLQLATLLAAQGSALSDVGRVEDAERVFDQARTLARSLDAQQLEAETLMDLANLRYARGDVAGTRELFLEALSLATPGHASFTRAQVLAQLCQIECAHSDDPRTARRYARESLELFRRLGNRTGEGFALTSVALVAQHCGELDEAADHLEQALEVFADIGERRRTFFAACNLGWVRQEQGDFDAAGRHYETALKMVRQGAEPWRHGAVLGMRALLLHERSLRQPASGQLPREDGLLEAARREYVIALAHLRTRGQRRHEGLLLGGLAAAEATLGNLNAAEDVLDATRELLQRLGDPQADTMVTLHGGHLDLLRARRGAGDERTQHRARARQRLADTATDARSDDVRFARRLLEAAVEQAEKEAHTERSRLHGGDNVLVAEDGSWFRRGADKPVDLRRRGPVRRLLATLAARRTGSPDAAITSDALFAAGWPAESIAPSSASDRLRWGIATLRRLGLRGALLTRSDGYLLSPEVEVTLSTTSAGQPESAAAPAHSPR